MTARYFTKAGDMVDAICWRYYGKQADAVEKVLEANPALADLGPILPAGRIIVLPDVVVAAEPEQVRLWD